MSLTTFIKQRPYLIWHQAEYETLSKEAIVEAVLNYGDFKDVKKLIVILGIKKVAKIFKLQTKGERVNYNPKILNYFNLYFNKHAA